MSTEHGRRAFIAAGAAATGSLLAGAAGAQEKPGGHQEHAGHGGPVGGPNDRGKLTPGRRKAGEPPVPVEAPDVPKLKWEMKGGVKEFHLHAKHLRREFLPGMWFDVWGYNDSMPGPTIEAVEGDRVRIVVHNELPEPTSMHWHGLEVPIAMDGAPGLTQEPIMPGKSFTYEFTLHQNGTYFYHSHGAMQEGMGMVGLFVIHPKAAFEPPVDRDFALVIQEWAILPNATVPNTSSMEFNFFTVNGRSAPYMTPMVVRQGDRVRLRMVNFSVIDHHPMHLHGLTFWVTGTEAGRIPETAWWPMNTVLVGVAQSRDIEFVANNPGDWMLHCHMFHHMMNHMTSMVGPMASHLRGPTAGGDMARGMGMPNGGHALSGEYGAKLGRGTGENTGEDRAVRTGPQPGQPGGMPAMPGMQGHEGHGASGKVVPGFPQDMSMMDMYTPAQVAKLRRPETRGMRKNWFTGVEGLMSVVRVLPPDLYDKVMSGKGEIPDGASVPGSGPGGMHGGHGDHGKEGEKPAPKKEDGKHDHKQ